MPNPFNLSDAPDLTDKSIKKMAFHHHKGKTKIKKVLGEFKKGTLHSGSGGKVTSRKQAVAIALSEARKAGANIPKRGGFKSLRRKSKSRFKYDE